MITSLPSTTADFDLAASGTASAPNLEASEGQAGPASSGGIEPSVHCLYFLVSAAKEGELVGTFKMGITDCLPRRHFELSRVWGAFDLARSALLRVGSRREAQRLESSLRGLFGDPRAENHARAKGRRLTSADFIAMGSKRRHPGRCDDGHREFYTMDCLPDVLKIVEIWLASHGKGDGAERLYQGIDPADCGWRGSGDVDLGPGGRDRDLGWRDRLRARCKQEAEVLDALASSRIDQVLALALEYEAHLLCVDLHGWRWAREINRPEHNHKGMANLFFGGFGACPSGPDTDPDGATPARRAFDERVQPLLAPVEYEDARGQRHILDGKLCTLQEPRARRLDLPRHLHGIGELLLRIEADPARPAHPLFAEFAALAARVEARQG